MSRIIALSGFAGSGKTTVSKILETYGYEHITYAGALKEIITILFGWDRNLIEGNTPESRIWRDTELTDIGRALHISDFTPRKAMQMIGTDCFRNNFSEDIWLYVVERKIANSNKKWVIGDARFHNELELAKKYNGITLRVIGKTEPEWLDIGIRAADGHFPSIELLKRKDIHESEWNWLNWDFDYTINNTGSLADLANTMEGFTNAISK